MKTKTTILAIVLSAPLLQAQDANLAKKPANPVSDLISVPVNFLVSQFIKIGDQPMQAFVGARRHAEKPDNGPEWGIRFGLTFLFPK